MNKRLVALAALAVLAGCGSGLPTENMSAVPNGAIAEHLGRGRSWMLPEAKGESLIYVSDQGNWYAPGVLVYSYPQGKQVGFLEPDTEEVYEGLCSDASGNIFVVGWITNGQSFYDEYPHGGTQPIADIIATSVPSSCSLDPSTGNLAVANYQDFENQRRGDIAIYQNAQGSPTDYSDSSITNYYYCAYDDNGNLFADGNTNFINELARNGDTFRHLYFNKKVQPGSLQWNGGSLVVTVLGGPKGATHVDRVSVAGSGVNITGTTTLHTYYNEGTYLEVQFWIQGKVIVGPGAGAGGPTRQLYIWPYPAGGKATKTIEAPSNTNFEGVTVSMAR